MIFNENNHLILGVTGASGSYAAQALVERSSWPVAVIISDWGKRVMQHEQIDIDFFIGKVSYEFKNNDLFALPSSGSVPTVGMVILPCSSKTLGQIATGTGSNLISRAAHCHLKERRPLILCIRESPLTAIDIENMKSITAAGGIIMPLCPPFFMLSKYNPKNISMCDLLNAFADRVLSLLGQRNMVTWENVQ